MPSFTIIRPGMLTTVQDLGRWGRQSTGVPVAGPMDSYSHCLANRLVGNDEGAAALEITLMGPELRADSDVLCAVAGAQFRLTIDGVPVPMHVPFELPAGSRLRFGERLAGSRATLAVRGGVDVVPQFGSRATSLSSAMGPFGGRPLTAGDILPLGDAQGSPMRGATQGARPLDLPRGGARLRIIRGPHDPMFTTRAFETLFSNRYTVTASSNRMGYRLDGPALEHAGPADILSAATPMGTLQVPGSGQPILLMADRQTTGGYPCIGTVITADLPAAGQLAPGDWIAFAPCNREDAVAALKAQRARLEGAKGKS
jgi:biotin-dependent carboxylase-like uncharacterized protein